MFSLYMYFFLFSPFSRRANRSFSSFFQWRPGFFPTLPTSISDKWGKGNWTQHPPPALKSIWISRKRTNKWTEHHSQLITKRTHRHTEQQEHSTLFFFFFELLHQHHSFLMVSIIVVVFLLAYWLDSSVELGGNSPIGWSVQQWYIISQFHSVVGKRGGGEGSGVTGR